jgi:uncharacterized OsmC-like protein
MVIDAQGGTIAYSIDHDAEIIQAVEDFSVKNTDEKAQLQAAYTLTNEKVCSVRNSLYRLVLMLDIGILANLILLRRT